MIYMYNGPEWFCEDGERRADNGERVHQPGGGNQ